MKAKLSQNLCSFITVRRGDWTLKVSVYKNREVLLIAQHYYDTERIVIKQFTTYDTAADYIELLAEDKI